MSFNYKSLTILDSFFSVVVAVAATLDLRSEHYQTLKIHWRALPAESDKKANANRCFS